MLQELKERIAELENATMIARGNQTTLEEDAEDAKAGRFQTEGRLAEARTQFELADKAGLEDSVTGLESRVAELETMIDPKILEKHDKEKT